MEQIFVNWAFGITMALLGWLGNVIWNAVQDLKRDVQSIEINLPTIYVTKEDYKSDVREIKAMLKELYDLQRNRRGQDVY